MQKTIVFDMDGVILDTEQLTFNCWKQVASKYGLQDIETIYKACIGTTLSETNKIFKDAYYPRFPLEKIQKDVLELRKKNIDLEGPPVKYYVKELLEFLKRNGFTIGLASSTNTEMIHYELDKVNLLNYFDTIVGGDMVERSKPNPDIFLYICNKLDANPKDVFIIEDSLNGIRAAYSAKAKPIMVPDLISPTQEVKKLCFKIFNDLEYVKNYFARNLFNPNYYI